MPIIDYADVHEEAALEFERRCTDHDGRQVVRGLVEGLDVVQEMLITRIRDDVQHSVGMDSMLIGPSGPQGLVQTEIEIELYQIAVSASEAWDYRYLPRDDDWYLAWLTKLRLGALASRPNVERRLAEYLSQQGRGRRLAFTDVLVRVIPEARRAPLILYRLYPLSVQFATALSFGDPLHAGELRNAQVELLSCITDCRECHGALLENGEKCRACGNPLWNYDWMTLTGR